MRYLAAAFVVVALIAADAAHDAGLIAGGNGWRAADTLALVWFALLVSRGDS